MAKLEIRGFFYEVGEVTEVGEKKTKVQKMTFMVFGYQDRSRGINDPDEPWVMDAIGKQVDELKLDKTYEGKSAKLTVYIKGFALAATETKKAYSGYQVNVGKVELIETRA